MHKFDKSSGFRQLNYFLLDLVGVHFGLVLSVFGLLVVTAEPGGSVGPQLSPHENFGDHSSASTVTPRFSTSNLQTSLCRGRRMRPGPGFGLPSRPRQNRPQLLKSSLTTLLGAGDSGTKGLYFQAKKPLIEPQHFLSK